MKCFNGYRASHRNKWKFIQSGILTIQELALLEFYADIFCFDRRKPEFGLFKVSFKEIARSFNCHPNTVRGWHKGLLKLRFITETAQKRTCQLTCCERYLFPGGWWQGKATYYQEKEKNQPVETILQSFGIDLQSIGQKIQLLVNHTGGKADATEKSTSIAKNSYKVESEVNKERRIIKQPTRSNEEYQKMLKEGNFTMLTLDDARWIDQNICETEENETLNPNLY